MLQVDQTMNINELHQQGHSIRQIAEMTGHSRNTVRKILRGQHDGKRKTANKLSKLDPFKD